MPTSEEMRAQVISVWDAINEYAASCGGDISENTISNRRMDAVVAVEKAIGRFDSQLSEMHGVTTMRSIMLENALKPALVELKSIASASGAAGNWPLQDAVTKAEDALKPFEPFGKLEYQTRYRVVSRDGRFTLANNLVNAFDDCSVDTLEQAQKMIREDNEPADKWEIQVTFSVTAVVRSSV